MRPAPRAALLLLALTAAAESGAQPVGIDPPTFACPEGTEPRMRAPRVPRGSIAASLSLVRAEKWCALPGPDGEVQHGPYLSLDADGNWIEWGDYEAVRRNGVPDRQVGAWHHRVPGTCGDWVEWATWRGPVRPTPEQMRAHPNPLMAANRAADCGRERTSAGVQSGPGDIREPRREPYVALSKICTAEDGTPEGPTWTWFANAAMRTAENQVAGLREGEFRAWHSNGKPRWQGSFLRGREHGVWRQFDCDGELRCEARAEAGRIVGSWRCSAGEAPPLEDWLGSLADPAPRPPPGS